MIKHRVSLGANMQAYLYFFSDIDNFLHYALLAFQSRYFVPSLIRHFQVGFGLFMIASGIASFLADFFFSKKGQERMIETSIRTVTRGGGGGARCMCTFCLV